MKAEETKTVKDTKSDTKTDSVDLDRKIEKGVCLIKTEENVDSPNRNITDKDTKENDTPNEKLTGKDKDKKDITASVKDPKEETHVTRSKVKEVEVKEKKQMTMDGFLTKGKVKESAKAENAEVQESKDSSKDENEENSVDLNKKKIATTKL